MRVTGFCFLAAFWLPLSLSGYTSARDVNRAGWPISGASLASYSGAPCWAHVFQLRTGDSGRPELQTDAVDVAVASSCRAGCISSTLLSYDPPLFVTPWQFLWRSASLARPPDAV